MNVLAHIYLSGDSDKIIIGNYIGDYVKGRDYLKYPELVRKGIILHRHIDAFTDRHPVVHRSKLFFSRKYYKYAGVIVDILYDHFLTKEWDFFSRKPLESVTYNFYRALVNHYEILPDNVRKMMPFFIINNWIESYQTVKGIKRVLNALSKRSSLPNETRWAIKTFKKNYFSLQDDFMEFFPQLIDYVEKDFGIPLSHDISIPF
ncbi:MAG TPA: ACP phosphodiesterase [Bacteroidales bacterium]|nr:ACP phosphodiesterase [Bacteroidales bacterium]HOK74872.1 ACP phosphodiesterase [Bacteroidales bacterium]HOM40670.1 ACP phosphodiesterase [Bacteroidales bacterium]HPP92771.1 ACP phosphodiesterase [Bacteroidales bacterium]HQK70308.1 ACP phosphodiesterase [Bacteroidales bacterium]